MTARWSRILIGLLIVPLFWCLFAFFAFVPFDRKTPAQRILAITGGVLTGLLFLLYRRRLIGLDGALWMALDVTFMAALYSIPLRDDIPAEAFGLNEKISETHEDRYEYARELFHILARCFVSPTREYLLQPHKIFVIKSAAYYWKRRGYVPSHLQAQLYRKLLLASRRFDETEVRYETGRCYNSPHGYVVIDHPERPIYADLWAAQNVDGYQFGQLVEMPSCEGLSLKGPEGEPYLRKPREDPRLSSRSRSR